MKTKSFFVLIFGLVLLSGCIKVEKKHYKFELTDGLSGKGSVKYMNIMTDSMEMAATDLRTLVDDYLNGSGWESPYMKNAQKTLFEENGYLCGEITFTFDDIRDAKFFVWQDKNVIGYNFPSGGMDMFSTSEKIFDTQGAVHNANAPTILWDLNDKVFEFETRADSVQGNYYSLLKPWKEYDGR